MDIISERICTLNTLVPLFVHTWVPSLLCVCVRGCVCACLFVCACHKRFARGFGKDVYLWLLVFSLVFLLSSIAVVKSTQSLSFLLSFFHFIKICQQPGGPFGCCLAAKYFFFCFPSLQPPTPHTPLLPPFCLFFEADVNRCLQRAVYLSLPRLVLSSDPRVNAFQRSIILCFYRLPMEGWKERDIQRLRESREQSNHICQMLWLSL